MLKYSWCDDNIPTTFKPCYDYIQSSLQQIFVTKEITDPTLSLSIKYSGRTYNDQGDVHACVVAQDLTFVEITQGPVFKGLCLNKVCHYTILQENISFLQELSNKYNLGVDFTQVSFSGSDADYPSQTNGVFIMTAFLFTTFLVLNMFAGSRNILKSIIKSKHNQSLNSNNGTTVMSQYSHNTEIEEKKQKKESLGSRLLSQFDIVNNTRKLFTLKSTNEDLTVFNAIRVFSFLQVIMGHEFLLRLSYLSNVFDLPIISVQFALLFVYSCLYSVDVFFLLGGFFVAYVACDPKMVKNFSLKKPVKVICAYLFGLVNRLFRIVPCYFMALLIFWQIVPQFGDSPTWFKYIEMAEDCNNEWWAKLLFIDNFTNPKSNCFGWGWYLSNDLQMYLFSMILVIIYANHRMAGKISMFCSILIFSGVGLYISFRDNLVMPVSVEVFISPRGGYYYYKPWCRCPPYFLGLLFGVFYKEYQTDKINKTSYAFLTKYAEKIANTFRKYICYLIGMGIILGLIMIPRPVQANGLEYWSTDFQHVWFAFMRLFYTLGISFIVLPSICGSKDLIVKFMSCKLFAFLARLSFCGYLVHFIVLVYTLWGSKDAMYMNIEGLLQLYTSESLITLFAAFLLHLFVEIPIMGLANVLFNKSRPPPKKETPVVESSSKSNSRSITQPFINHNVNSTLSLDKSKNSEILYSEKPNYKEIQDKNEEKN